MDDFDKEIKEEFLVEATQILDDLEASFLSFENDPSNKEILEELFRGAHNLKGSGRAVGFGEVAEFTHELENLLSKLKNDEVVATRSVIDLLLEVNDQLRTMIEGLKSDLDASFDTSELRERLLMAQEGKLSEEENLNKEAVEESEGVEEGAVVEEREERPVNLKMEEGSEDSFNESEFSDSLDNCERKEAKEISETLDQKMDADKEKKTETKKDRSKKLQVEETIRVPLSRIELLNNYVGELVIILSVLKQKNNSDSGDSSRKIVTQMEKIIKEIQDISMSLRMLPVKQVFTKMQRIVRDTSKLLNKKVNLTLMGDQTEVDKTILEYINDPLVHIIRNAVDHGLESPEKRKEIGKPEVGNIVLSAYHEGSNLVIEVQDDGKGLDPDVLRSKALEKGLLKKSQKISDKEAMNLIFHPGFSTKQQASEVSGRGVGMDVVKTNINRLSGDIEIRSEVGTGTTFRIILPLTLSIIDGMVAVVGSYRFILPVSQINETLRPDQQQVSFVTGLGYVMNLRGKTIPLIPLSQVLKLKTFQDDKNIFEGQIAVVSKCKDMLFALLVDDIIAKQQVVVKKLGDEIQNKEYFSGVSILGDGMPSLIIDLEKILIHQKDFHKNNLKSHRKVG